MLLLLGDRIERYKLFSMTSSGILMSGSNLRLDLLKFTIS